MSSPEPSRSLVILHPRSLRTPRARITRSCAAMVYLHNRRQQRPSSTYFSFRHLGRANTVFFTTRGDKSVAKDEATGVNYKQPTCAGHQGHSWPGTWSRLQLLPGWRGRPRGRRSPSPAHRQLRAHTVSSYIPSPARRITKMSSVRGHRKGTLS